MDLLMDLGMILVAQLCFARLSPRRILWALALMRICTLAAMVLNIGGISAVLAGIPVYLLASAAATGAQRSLKLVEAACCMYCFAVLAAGLTLLPRGPMIFSAGCAAFIFLLRRRRHPQYCWYVDIRIEISGASARIPALIDTGNRLREPRSGLPVLIIEERAAPEICAWADSVPAGELRSVPFGVLGGAGAMRCFRPDSVEFLLENGPAAAPECRVALFPGRIPGNIRALAPPEFMQVYNCAGTSARSISKGIRRMKAWHFQA